MARRTASSASLRKAAFFAAASTSAPRRAASSAIFRCAAHRPRHCSALNRHGQHVEPSEQSIDSIICPVTQSQARAGRACLSELFGPLEPLLLADLAAAAAGRGRLGRCAAARRLLQKGLLPRQQIFRLQRRRRPVSFAPNTPRKRDSPFCGCRYRPLAWLLPLASPPLRGAPR